MQQHGTAMVDYIAWEMSAGMVDGLLFEVNNTADVVTNQVYVLRFTASFATPPMFLAEMQTYDEDDLATLRWSNKTPSQWWCKPHTHNFYDRCAHKDRIFERWLALLTLAHYRKFYSSSSSINYPSLWCFSTEISGIY